MLKAAIYDPYLDTLGGGERYILTVAEILSHHGYQVDLFWSGNQNLLTTAASRFSLDLKNVSFKPASLITSSLISKYQHTKSYDLFFYLSDGSIPFLFSKKNLLHLQVPFTVPHHGLLDQIKLKFINLIVCNSQFTKHFIDQNYTPKNTVLYPPIDIDKFSISSKENIILSVGRFDNVLNAKRQDILIEAFKQLSSQAPDWKLVLVGGSLQDPQTNKYLRSLKTNAKNFPIEFYVNPDFNFLKDTYSRSSIYWHAAGYDVDQSLHPEATEHFGMTVVEAMSAGLVPLVVNRGGLPEIINHSQNGYLWESVDQLVDLTLNLIHNKKLLLSLSQKSQASSANFSKAVFTTKLLDIIHS